MSAIFPWGIHIWNFKTLACMVLEERIHGQPETNMPRQLLWSWGHNDSDHIFVIRENTRLKQRCPLFEGRYNTNILMYCDNYLSLLMPWWKFCFKPFQLPRKYRKQAPPPANALKCINLLKYAFQGNVWVKNDLNLEKHLRNTLFLRICWFHVKKKLILVWIWPPIRIFILHH